MELPEFIEKLQESGWKAVGDAQHTQIKDLWCDLLKEKKDAVAKLQCSDGLVALTDLAHEMGLLVKSARSKERNAQIEAEAHELAEARVLIKIEKIKRETGN